mmetsp:Transcript_83149/g.146895  ORF Transcript_83149/g.146895 Transcript_83149/m.146895 type:complete len:252 (-) Transcript_83149:1624-2379(-)
MRLGSQRSIWLGFGVIEGICKLFLRLQKRFDLKSPVILPFLEVCLDTVLCKICEVAFNAGLLSVSQLDALHILSCLLLQAGSLLLFESDLSLPGFQLFLAVRHEVFELLLVLSILCHCLSLHLGKVCTRGLQKCQDLLTWCLLGAGSSVAPRESSIICVLISMHIQAVAVLDQGSSLCLLSSILVEFLNGLDGIGTCFLGILGISDCILVVLPCFLTKHLLLVNSLLRLVDLALSCFDVLGQPNHSCFGGV